MRGEEKEKVAWVINGEGGYKRRRKSNEACFFDCNNPSFFLSSEVPSFLPC